MRSPYRVESLRLHQIGVFDDLSIEFPSIASGKADEEKAEIHVLTGSNGCGKSTVLYALARMFVIRSHGRQIKSRFRGSDSWMMCVISGQNGYFGANKPSDQKGTVWRPFVNDASTGEFFSFENNALSQVYINHILNSQNYNPNNSRVSPVRFEFCALAYSGRRDASSANLNAIQEVTSSPFENALSFDATVRPHVLIQWIGNRITEAALARAEGNEAEAAQYEQSLARISNFIQAVSGLVLGFRLQRKPLAVRITRGDVEIDFDVLPDGLKSIISWVGDLCIRLEAIPWAEPGDPFSQPVILLLDEVDIHLHPQWQRRILPALQKLLPKGQVFVSTHSPFVVGSVQDAWIYTLPEPGTTQGPVTVQAIPSGAGKSYRLILEETFGIDGEFDIETEQLLADFYAARQHILENQQVDAAELLGKAREITARSEEAGQIVARELRQLARLTQRELSLA